MCKLIWCLVAVAYALTASLTASVAVAWTPDYAPWVLLTGAFNGSVKGVGFMPGPGAAGTAFVYGDTGGLYRSDDCGDHWDYARGGAPVSDGRRGGYPDTNDADCGCQAGTSCSLPDTCKHGMAFGSAAASEPTMVGLTTSNTAWGQLPSAVQSDPGVQSVVPAPTMWGWSTSNFLNFTLDGGVHQSPVPTECVGFTTNPKGKSAVAVDLGNPGHLIVASAGGETMSPFIPGGMEASGCQQPFEKVQGSTSNFCGQRQIAWTEDIAPQALAVRAAQKVTDTAGAFNIDVMSKWHYASVAHLAAPIDKNTLGNCDFSSDPNALPRSACPRSFDFCHGRQDLSGPVEDACLNPGNPDCKCNDIPTCRYPNILGLQIDPRNGWAYASSDVGLLVSDDGGRSWSRTGTEAQPALKPNAGQNAPNPAALSGSQPGTHGARLLTGASFDNWYTDDAYYMAAVGDGINVFETGMDLQLAPSRIVRVGRMSLTFKQTTGTWPDGRPKGHVTAYVPVTWHSKENGQWLLRSSVFMAFAYDSDDRFKPLIFRDVNGLNSANNPDDPNVLQRYCSSSESNGALPLPKLPRSQQRDSHHAFHPSTAQQHCPYRVEAVAAAPSDPRIAYAVLSPSSFDNPVACPTAPAPECNDMAGIYQTLDRGLTWSFVLGQRSPHAPNALNGMSTLTPWHDIVVSAKNPYVAWFSGVEDGWYRLQPIHALPSPPADLNTAGVLASLPPPSGCQACGSCAPVTVCHPFTIPDLQQGQQLGNNQLWNAGSTQCDKTTTMPDMCGLFAQFGGDNPSGLEPAPIAPATNKGACTLPAGSFLPAPTGWTNAGAYANLGVPPACTYHPASAPSTPTSLILPCVDCLLTEPATWASCSATVTVSPTLPPPRCCMGAVPMATVRSGKVCEGNVNTPKLSVNTGVSEEAVFHATTLATKLNATDPLVEAVVIGSHDSGGQISALQSAATTASWQSMGFAPMQWFSAIAPASGSTATSVATAAPNAVFEYVLPAKTVLTGSPPTATGWALSSRANCAAANDSLLDLVRLTISANNNITATVVGSVAKGVFPGAPWNYCNPNHVGRVPPASESSVTAPAPDAC